MDTADEPQDGASDGRTQKRLVTERALVRRPAGGRLGWAILLVPLLIAALAGFLARPGLESALADEAEAALRAEQIKGVEVVADGVFVTAKVPTRVDGDRVRTVLGEVDGVATVDLEQVFASKAEERACTNLERKLHAATNKQRIPFVGRTTRLTPAGQSMVRAAAKLVAACGSARVLVGGHTDDATPDGPTLTLQRSRVMIKVMRSAGAPADRLLPRGYGAQYLVDRGDSAAARARNERGSIILEGS